MTGPYLDVNVTNWVADAPERIQLYLEGLDHVAVVGTWQDPYDSVEVPTERLKGVADATSQMKYCPVAEVFDVAHGHDETASGCERLAGGVLRLLAAVVEKNGLVAAETNSAILAER